MDLFAIYAALPRPSQPGSFSAERSDGNVRVARSFDGHPAILIAFQSASGEGVARRLAMLAYHPPASVDVVATDGHHSAGEVAILECTTSESELASYFFQVVTSILLPETQAGDEARFESALDAVISLFRALQKPGVRTTQGLWAELAVIAWSRRPLETLTAWHSSPRALHDFAAGSMRLEVKSTSLELREHTFLLEQLATRHGGTTLVASLILEEERGGTSVMDLVTEIRRRVGGQAEPTRRLEAIVAESVGIALVELEGHRYDLDAARRSVLLYPAEAIPTIPEPLPTEVRHVQFTVDLSTTTPVSIEDGRRRGPFFEAILPDA